MLWALNSAIPVFLDCANNVIDSKYLPCFWESGILEIIAGFAGRMSQCHQSPMKTLDLERYKHRGGMR